MRYFFILLIIILIYSLKPLNLEDISKLKSKEITVEVKGYLKNPGMFTIKSYSNINDLVNELELYPDSNLDHLSLNKQLLNEDIVIVNKNDERSMISINSASLEELMTLKGIGDKIAQRIIDYRTNVKHFDSIEAIKNVKGIGEAIFENIKDFIIL